MTDLILENNLEILERKLVEPSQVRVRVLQLPCEESG